MTRVTNCQRAHWAAIAIEAFRDHVGTDDDETSIHDLIADLGHYCALNGLDFVRTTSDAISCWALERAHPDDRHLGPGPKVSIIIHNHTRRGRASRQTAITGKRAPRSRRGGAS